MGRVLIVDDAAFMRYSIRSMLERNGFEVVGEAEDGAIAVNMYKECQPDIVTMDITMPVMDGVNALKAIRDYDPKAKVVMVSALGEEKRIREAVISGAKGFIIKPFKEEHILATINKIIAL